MRSLHPAAPSKLLLACLLVMGLSKMVENQSTTCSSKFPNCSVCNAGNTQCQKCADAFYLRSSDKTCPACHSSCLTCSGSGFNSCLSCRKGQYEEALICNRCPTGCSACQSGSFCSECSQGYYQKEFGCSSCGLGCEACDNAISCTRCDTGYTLEAGECQADASNTTKLPGGAVAGMGVWSSSS